MKIFHLHHGLLATVSSLALAILLWNAPSVAADAKKEQGAPKSSKKSSGDGKKPDAKKAAESDPDKEGGEDSKDAKPEAREKGSSAPGAGGPDEEYVKANLKDFVQGTVTFDKDGTLTIEYDFKSKKEEFADDFLPPIASKPQGVFRWSVYQEEHVIGGDEGVRISDRGAAVLNVWFTDEVEAETEFLQGIGWSARQICALVFQVKGGKALANNYGGQCANFSGALLSSAVPPKTESCPFDKRVKIGLRLKGGTYEALRDGKSRGSQKYSPKSFSSGRIGFIWGGNLAGTLTSLRVKGKVDFTATAAEMRKRVPGK